MRSSGRIDGTATEDAMVDMSGNRTGMTTLEGVNAYTYDAHNWLTSAIYPDGRAQEFGYDPVGNRVSLTDSSAGVSPVSYTYDAANRLLTSVSATDTNSYTYDNAGRLTNQTVNGEPRTYSYSFRSQMTSLTDTNGTAFSYDFDGDGNRISASVAGCLTARYVYDGPNVVLDLNGSNQVTRAYINGPGIDQPIERIDFVNGEPRTRLVYHTDGLGSVVAMTDSEQQTARSYSYEAFGKIRSETGALVINRYTFTGREALGDSLGLYYYRWRVMDPSAGRFTSEDPLGFVDDFSLYRYLSNSPLSGTDPRGQVGPIVRRIIFRPIPLGGPYIPISCTLIYTLDTVSRRYCHWDCIDGHWSDMVGDRVSRVTETCPNASCPHPTS